jgi:hypothetical protein
MDDPGHSDCQEALLNNIEDLTVENWPRPLVLAMPALPYTCNKPPGSGHRVAAPFGVTPKVTTSLPWSIVWTGDLRSFLIGRHTAAADLAGTVMPSGAWITPTVWDGTTMNYLFREGESEVMASGGGTGVVELGTVEFETPSGAFWNGTLHIVLDSLTEGDWECLVGPAGKTVRATGRNVVTLDYPIAWTTVQGVLAEGVRNQFRQAARIAVTGVGDAADPCATFFWTGSHNVPVARYQPRYLIGEGLEDVGMEQIAGMRIHYQWSQQAASCFASDHSYGYFSNRDFSEVSCSTTESCFPGVRFKKLSVRLTDVRDVVRQLNTPNPDPVFQDSLSRAKTSSYLVIDAMANATRSTASFLDGLAGDYQRMVDQIDVVLTAALPASVRTAVLDQLCSLDNVARLEALDDQCFDQGTLCELSFLFDAINNCIDYQGGQALDDLIGRLTTTRAGLAQERDGIIAEHDAITQRWAEIQGLR